MPRRRPPAGRACGSEARTVELLVNRGGGFEAGGGGGLRHSTVLPELTLDLAGLWAEIDARDPRTAG